MSPGEQEALFRQIGQDMANLFKRVTELEQEVFKDGTHKDEV